jgi:hypothetical protein
MDLICGRGGKFEFKLTAALPLTINDPKSSDPREQILWDRLFPNRTPRERTTKKSKMTQDETPAAAAAGRPADSILIESHANEALTERT